MFNGHGESHRSLGFKQSWMIITFIICREPRHTTVVPISVCLLGKMLSLRAVTPGYRLGINPNTQNPGI